MNKVRKYGRGPAKFRQIRQIGKNSTNNVPIYGATIPTLIAEQFGGVFFSIRCNDHQIILESGCKNG